MIDRNKIIEEIRQMTSKSYPDSEIILYGSQARGDYGDSSDWDLLILLNKSNIPFDEETKIMDDFYELELSEGIVISPMIYSKSDWETKYSSIPLHLNIDKEGIRIK